MGEWAEINREIWQNKRKMAKSTGCLGLMFIPLVWLFGVLKVADHG